MLFGGVFLLFKFYCSSYRYVMECSIIGLKPISIFVGVLLTFFGLLLHNLKDRTLSDEDSILRFHEIDSHCPHCYAQGVVKSSGLFSHKITCPKCGKHWRILDL
jgi:transposase-like protein